MKKHPLDGVRDRLLELMTYVIKTDPKVKSRRAFGKRINVPPARINEWENKRGHPRMETVINACREFAAPPEYLLLGIGDLKGLELIKRIERIEKKLGIKP